MLTTIRPDDIRHYVTPVRSNGFLVLNDPSYIIGADPDGIHHADIKALTNPGHTLGEADTAWVGQHDRPERLNATEATALLVRAPVGIHYVIVSTIPDPDDITRRRVAALTVRMDGGTAALTAKDGQQAPYTLSVDTGALAVHDPVATVAHRRWGTPEALRTALANKQDHRRLTPTDPDGSGTLVVCDTGFGDGNYPVYTVHDEFGALTGIVVEFIDDYEYNLWCAEDRHQFMADHPCS